MPTTATQEIERVAYHEAGHAVVSVRFKRKFNHVTITPGAIGTVGYLGITYFGVHSAAWMGRVDLGKLSKRAGGAARAHQLRGAGRRGHEDQVRKV